MLFFGAIFVRRDTHRLFTYLYVFVLRSPVPVSDIHPRALQIGNTS